jgi:phospholipid/cholesterol/gamma-HCH transport system permease protein
MLSLLERTGAVVIESIREMGRMGIFFSSFLTWAFRRPLKFERITQQIHFIGVKSLFVIVLTASFSGMVLGLQGYYTLQKFGSEGLLGSAVALSLIRELGPVLAALMVTGRAGSAIAAEIGIMKITEQIDALEVMAINPIKYLVVPKILAGLIAIPLLAAMFDVIGIYGGYLVGVKLLGVSAGSYFSQMEVSVVFRDVYTGVIKSVCFGVLLTWVCCYKGYYAGHGAAGVSKATTEAVVLASVLILVLDYFLTSILL